MNEKLFVGGLSWDTTDESLRAAFQVCGPVLDAKVITDRETGRSRGFGFVTMDSPASATEAISALDGTELDGRTIRVNVAQERSRGGGGGGGRDGGFRGGRGGGRGGRDGGRGGRGGGGGRW